MDKIDFEALMRDLYKAAIKAAPQLTTPPVLRWERDALMLGCKLIAHIYTNGAGYWLETVTGEKGWGTRQEARRAAEKALGFPDGLVVEEL